ncbi:hypothetical protein [Stanieria cyanosphaera]|nr:hypothetical protein [Stanieria cyanosphaera]
MTGRYQEKPLTPRELKAAKMMAQGASQREIAKKNSHLCFFSIAA